jgi:hypothetical protein
LKRFAHHIDTQAQQKGRSKEPTIPDASVHIDTAGLGMAAGIAGRAIKIVGWMPRCLDLYLLQPPILLLSFSSRKLKANFSKAEHAPGLKIRGSAKVPEGK